DRPTLIGVRRPEMERSRSDLKGESGQGHDDSNEKQWRDRLSIEFLRDSGEPGRVRHPINKADPKKRECAGGAAEEEIFQPGLGCADVGLIECSHDIQGETEQLETDEDHE